MAQVSQGREGERGTRRALATCCVLLVICALTTVTDLVGLVGEQADYAASSTILLRFGDLVSIAACILMCWTAARGISLLRGTASANSRLVNTCQSLDLASGGLALTRWIAGDATFGHYYSIEIVGLVLTIAVIAVFYFCCARLETCDFWDDPPEEAHPDLLYEYGSLAREFALDLARGRLRPLRPGEEPALLILTPEDYLAGLEASVADHVALAGTKRCQCLLLRGAICGCVRIPSVALPACGCPAGSDIVWSFCFANGVLRLTYDADDGTAGLITRLLVDQRLRKHSPIAFIPEMIGLLITGAPDWLLDYRGRLAAIEDRLVADVMEMPEGFFEFISHTRRRLRLIQDFFEQITELLVDLTAACEVQENLACAQLARTLAHRADRIAEEAEDLREYAAEIRESYQERIDVRQNHVMSLLTVVTTVFTPLSIVTGWYGMNFADMPELHAHDAYPILIALMALTVSLEIAFFKRRRWF